MQRNVIHWGTRPAISSRVRVGRDGQKSMRHWGQKLKMLINGNKVNSDRSEGQANGQTDNVEFIARD